MEPPDIPIYELNGILTMNSRHIAVFIEFLGLTKSMYGDDPIGGIALALGELERLTYPPGITKDNLRELVQLTSPSNIEYTRVTIALAGLELSDNRTEIMLQYLRLHELTAALVEAPVEEPGKELIEELIEEPTEELIEEPVRAIPDPRTIPVYSLREVINMDPSNIPTFLDFLHIRFSKLDRATGKLVPTEGDAVGIIAIILADLNKLTYPRGINATNISQLVYATDLINLDDTKALLRTVGRKPSSDRVNLMLQYLKAMEFLRTSPRKGVKLAPIETRYTLPMIFNMNRKNLEIFQAQFGVKDGDPRGEIALILLDRGLLTLEDPITAFNLPSLIQITEPRNLAYVKEFVERWMKTPVRDTVSRYELMLLYLESSRRRDILTKAATPTYNQDIRHFFRFKDINTMRRMDIDLGSYEGVKANADIIYKRVAAKEMPCDEPWDDYRIIAFGIWVESGTPR